MTAQSETFEALLGRLGGGPRPGHLGVVAARRGVGKTAILVHAALQAMLAGRRVLQVSATDGVERVRAWYDELLRAGGVSHAAALEVERRRMVLSYLDRPFDPAHIGEHARLLRDVAHFPADMVVIDGLDDAVFAAARAGLVALSSDLDVGLWVSVAADRTIPLGPDMAFGLRLAPEDGAMRLHLDGGADATALPWSLDAATHLLGQVQPREAHAARVPASEVTLYSGGAAGAEAAFGEAAARHGVREVNFTFEGHRQARTQGATPLGPKELEAGDVSLVYVSRRLHRTFNENGLIRKVLQALWHMVSRAQQVFVVGDIQADGTVTGGTGWSVELARLWSKEVWVYDQVRDGWFTWNGVAWVAGTPHLHAREVCGTGTRNLTPAAAAAVEALFADAFGA